MTEPIDPAAPEVTGPSSTSATAAVVDFYPADGLPGNPHGHTAMAAEVDLAKLPLRRVMRRRSFVTAGLTAAAGFAVSPLAIAPAAATAGPETPPPAASAVATAVGTTGGGTSMAVTTALGKFYGVACTRTVAPVIVALIGDSYTAYTGTWPTPFSARLQAGWPSSQTPAVSADLTTARSSRSNAVQVVDMAVNGSTSASSVTTTTRDQIAALTPALYVIMLGANDVYKDAVPPAQYQTNIQAIINYQKTANPLPCSFVLVHAYPRQDVTVTNWEQYGQALQNIANGDTANVTYLDLTPIFAAVGIPGENPLSLLQSDLIHPNDSGTLLIADLIFAGIQQQLPASTGPTVSLSSTPALTIVTAPGITSTASIGSTATTSAGTWSATPDSVTYQWKRAGAAIPGATASTYTLVSADSGQAITVTATAVKAGYTAGSATSNSVTPGASVPRVPTGLTATAGNASATLAWTAPTSNGGAAITDYQVEYQPASGSWATFTHTASTSTAATVRGLTNGTVNSFRVSAINSAGTSTASGTATATPAALSSTTVVADNFNRADNGSSLGTASDGVAWQVFGDRYQYLAGNGGCAYQGGLGVAYREVSTANFTMQVTILLNQIGAIPNGSGPTFRVANATDYWAVVALSGGWALQKNVSGTFSTPTGGQSTATPAAGDVLKVVTSGSTITLYVNGTQKAMVTDSFNSTATKVGLGGWSASGSYGVKIDDLTVTVS